MLNLFVIRALKLILMSATDECTRKFAVPSLDRSSQFQVAFIVPSPYNFAHRAKTLYYMQQCRGKHHYFQIGYLNCREKKEEKKRKNNVHDDLCSICT